MTITPPEYKSEDYPNKFILIFHNDLAAWVILTISIILTSLAYYVSNTFIFQRGYDQFKFRTHEIEIAIVDRMHIYEQVLRGGVALFYASGEVSRESWKEYVATLNLDKYWPGIQAIGYSIPLDATEINTYVERIRSEGFQDFSIKPEGNRKEYSSITYIEPFDWRNQRAFGFDMWSNEMRRLAMAKARDTGEASTSGIITLVQETQEAVQKGFLTYLPVYKSKITPSDEKERKKQFQGWVYAAFRAGDLMKGILGSGDTNIEFECFDGNEFKKENLLFQSSENFHCDLKDHRPTFVQQRKLNLQGREWTLYFYTPEGYSIDGVNQPRMVAIAGIFIDLMLFYVIYALSSINRRAQKIARRMTLEVENSKADLEKQVTDRTRELQLARDELESKVFERTKELEERVAQLDRMNKFMVNRENKMAELKRELKILKENLSDTSDGRGESINPQSQ